MVRGHADRDGPGAPRAARPGHRSRRLRFRQPLLGGVRHRGDSACAPPRRGGGARVLGAHRLLHRRGDRDRDHVVPSEHRGVPAGRQRLHRGQGQPGGLPGPDRGRRPPHRLHPDGGGERLRRSRRAHLRLPGALPVPGRARRGPGGARRGGEPAGHSRVRPGVRGVELPVHRRVCAADGLRLRGARDLGPPPGGVGRAPSTASRRARRVPAPACLRLRRGRPHRDRGGLGRHPGVPAAGGAQRADRARGPRRDHDHAVPRHHGAGGQLRDRAARPGDRGLPARPRGLRGRPALLLHPGRLDGHPGPRGQHRVRRLPPAGVVHGARRVPAPAVREPGRPAGVLERGHHPGGGRVGADRALRREHALPDPALRPRGLHVVHAVAGGHGAPLAHAAAPRDGGRRR